MPEELRDAGYVLFDGAAEFEQWLERSHADAPEVFIALPGKGNPVPSVTRREAWQLALCFGWIDGLVRSSSLPDGWWAQRFTPRRPRSNWSLVNCRMVDKLIARGRMRPAGLREVERARADGRWRTL